MFGEHCHPWTPSGQDLEIGQEHVCRRQPAEKRRRGLIGPAAGERSAEASWPAAPGPSQAATRSRPRMQMAVIDVRVGRGRRSGRVLVGEALGEQVDVPQPQKVDGVVMVGDAVHASRRKGRAHIRACERPHPARTLLIAAAISSST